MADTTQQQAPQRSLIKKLAEVMAEVERVPKDGHNSYHGYDYATESAITAAVRGGMARRNLMLVSSVVDTKLAEIDRKNGGKDRLVSLLVEFTVHDGDSGETLAFRKWGEGQDPGDKASYKAETGALKYALLKLFQIPTGDDPERDGSTPAPRDQAVQQRAERPQGGGDAPGSEVVKFGRDKGKKLSEVDDAGLAWLEAAAAKDVAKNDPKWHTKNLAWQASVKAEIARRAKPATPPQAPAAPAPMADPFAWAVKQLNATGVPYKEYSAKLKEWGKKGPKEVTEADARRLVTFFSSPSEPPPPGDEHAPGGGA